MLDSFDFDTIIDRAGTCSLKWQAYPDGVLPLWVADMDFRSPPSVVAALEARAAHGVYGYSVVTESLVAALVDYLGAMYGWTVEPEWLVWLPGVVPALNLVCRAFAAPDEAVMTVTPVYPPFIEAPRFQERAAQFVPAEFEGGRWRLPLAAMEEAVTPATRVFMFCHPHNPLGRAWERREVAAVTDFCRRHDLVLCSDEIHCDLRLDPVEHVPAATLDTDALSRTITLMSPSKTYNVPGLNFAVAVVADPELRLRFVDSARGPFSLPGYFAVPAAEAALREGAPWLAALLEYLRSNRDLLEETVAREMPLVRMAHVEATYLAWLDVRRLELPAASRSCELAGVGLSDGAAFGDPGFLRLNFGCPRSVLEEALRRLVPVLRGR